MSNQSIIRRGPCARHGLRARPRLLRLESRVTPHGPGFAGPDVAYGVFTYEEVEAMAVPVPVPNLSTKSPPVLFDGGHEADVLTIVLDFKEPTQIDTSDIFGHVVGSFDITGYGFLASDFKTVTEAIAAEVNQDYFTELVGTVAGPPGKDLRVDFVIGDIGVAPPGVTEYYYIQIGSYESGGSSGGALGVAGGSVVRNSKGNGPNFGIATGDVVGSVFTDNINGIGGLTPSNALTSGNLTFTTFGVCGTLSHEIGHVLSLSHINKAGSVQAVAGTAPLMGTGAIDLPNQDRITDRSFSLSGFDGQNGDAPRMHVQQLVNSVGLHDTGSMTAAIDGTGQLVITDANGSKANNWTITFDGAKFVIADAAEKFATVPAGGTLSNGNTTLTIPISAPGFTGGVVFNGAGGGDTLTVDWSAGDFTRDVAFAGGAGTDQLAAKAGSFADVAGNFTNANDGKLVLDSAAGPAPDVTLSYTGLESASLKAATVGDIVFNLPAAGTNATLADDGTAGNALSKISGAGLLTTIFNNPANSLAVNRGNAADTVTVNALPDFSRGLMVGAAGARVASFQVAGAMTLAGSSGVTALANVITVGATVTTAGGPVTLSATTGVTLNKGVVTGGGDVALSADADGDGTGGLIIATGGTVAAGAGTIAISAATADIQGPVSSTKAISINSEQTNRPIDLGTNSAGTLALTDGELDQITAGTLTIGSNAAGDLTVSATVNRAAATDIVLLTGGDLVISGGEVNTGGGTLKLDPGTTPKAVRPTAAGLDATASTVSFGSDLAIDVNGTTADSGHTQLKVAGTVNLAGVDLVLGGAYVPAAGDTFTIVSATSVAGAFNGLPEGTAVTLNGKSLFVRYSPTAVTLAPAPPQVAGVIVNGGASQRSSVTSLQVTFDGNVSFAGSPESAFELTKLIGGATVTLAAAVDNSGPATVVNVTFTGGAVDGPSLSDGRYQLKVLAGQVSNAGGGLDGNGDGAPGDDFVLVGDPAVAPKLFRLFGDGDGDGDVDVQDFGSFRGVFGTPNTVFDSDGDGDVDVADFGAFRGRFGTSV